MKRALKVLTKQHGVRDENPLLAHQGMYLHPSQRTPALRAEADELSKEDRLKRRRDVVAGKLIRNQSTRSDFRKRR